MIAVFLVVLNAAVLVFAVILNAEEKEMPKRPTEPFMVSVEETEIPATEDLIRETLPPTEPEPE